MRSTIILACATLAVAFASPVRALTCEALVLEEAIAFTKKQPREKWFSRSARTPEENARLWVASPKGQAQIAKDRARKRRGCD